MRGVRIDVWVGHCLTVLARRLLGRWTIPDDRATPTLMAARLVLLIAGLELNVFPSATTYRVATTRSPHPVEPPRPVRALDERGGWAAGPLAWRGRLPRSAPRSPPPGNRIAPTSHTRPRGHRPSFVIMTLVSLERH